MADDEEEVDPILLQFEQWKTQPMNSAETKRTCWIDFLSIWSELLQFRLDEKRSVYETFSRSFDDVFKSVSFFTNKRNVSVAKQSFTFGLTQLNRSHIRDYFQISKDEENSTENEHYFRHVERLLFIVSQTLLFISFINDDELKLVRDHIELLRTFVERLDRSMPEHSKTMIDKNYSLGPLNERMLSIFWNMTDRTIVVPVFLQCDLPRRIINWLGQAAMLNDSGRRPLISITHNISRHDDGADELSRYGAIAAIKQYQSIKVDVEDSRTLIASMALALLSTPEQIKQDKKGMNSVLNQLIQLAIKAAKDPRFRSGGFHVSEPLAVLVKMFVVEERTVDYVLSHAEIDPPIDLQKLLQLFTSLFFKFAREEKSKYILQQFTLIALLNMFWSFSFQPIYAKELFQIENFVETVRFVLENENKEILVEQYTPRSMESLSQAATGILHNLDVKIKNERIHSKKIDEKPSVMISYCHMDDAFCSRLLEFFSTKSNEFQIWIDRTHCQAVSDLWAAIADGMERASVIVCLLSDEYFESKSCRQEFIYAIDSLKKPLIPILLGNFSPKGWLGIRMSGLKYVRFRDLVQWDPVKSTELLNSVSLCLSPTKELVINIKSSPHPVQHIDESPISRWFHENHLSTKLRDLFDFRTRDEMLNYAELLMKNRDRQMEIYEKIYAEKYAGEPLAPHEFLRFTVALENLLKEQRPNVKSSFCSIS